MIRLSRHLRITAAVDALSFILLVLIPSDKQGAGFLGFSTARLAMLSLLGLFLCFLAWSLKALHDHPGREQSVQEYLLRLLQKPWIGRPIQLLAALMIVLVIFLIAGNFIYTNFQFRGIFLRLIPALLLLVCIAIQILIFVPVRSSAGRWAGILLYSILCTGGGILIQQFLLQNLDRATKIPFQFFFVNWLVTFFVSIVLITMLSNLPKSELAVWRMVVALAVILFAVQMYFSPNWDWPSKLDLALYANLLVMGAVILTKLAFDMSTLLATKYPQRSKGALLAGLGIILILFAILYYNGASAHERMVNTIAGERDQMAYLNFAKNAKLQNFAYPGDFNRMPLYPYLLALGYRPEMSDQEFFAQGKQLSILLSLILLVMLFVIFTRFFSIYQTFLLTSISAFSLFIFKAGYVKVELQYYFFVLLAFILMLQMLHKPGKILGIATGIGLGLAYLSKASALLGLYLFTVVYLSMVVVSVFRLLREKKKDWHPFVPSLQWVFYLALTLLAFFAITYPYTRVAKQRFGHYFYNINSTFYLWFDNIEGAMRASQKYGFTQKWPDQLSVVEIPGPQKYLREHSAGQIIERLRFGMVAQAYNLYNQYTFTNYLLCYLAIFAISVLVNIRNAGQLARRYPFVIGFALLFILAQLLSFAWYSSISAGPRFTFGIFLPLIFSLFAGIKGLTDYQIAATSGAEAYPSLAKFNLAANIMITGTLVFNIWLILSTAILAGQFGS